MEWWRLGIAAFLVPLSFNFASADDLKDGARVSIKLTSGTLDKETIQQIFKLSEAKSVPVENPSTLAEIVAQNCGQVDEAYFALVSLANAGKVPSENPDKVQFKRGQMVRLPPCIPKQSIKVRQTKVAPNDSEWKYFESVSDLFSWSAEKNPATIELLKKSAQAVEQSTGIVFDDERSRFVGPNGKNVSYRDFFAALNDESGSSALVAGQTALVPEPTSRWITIETSSIASTTDLQKVSSTLASLPSVESVDTGDRFQHIVDLSSPCVTNAVRESEVNELSRILLELGPELNQRRVDLSPIRIEVLDSGIVAKAGSIVSPDRIGETTGLGLYDTRLTPQDYAPVSAPDVDRFRDHGTKVASLVLGGRSHAAVASQLGFSLVLVPARIYELEKEALWTDDGKPVLSPSGSVATRTKGKLRDDRIYEALDRTDIDILHLSLGRHEPLQSFVDQFGPTKAVLYVVAAGNHGKDLVSAANAFYPASYGGEGEGRDNLITVTSVDGDGKLSSFANFGVGVVDIAAPGCGVKAQGYNFVTDTAVTTNVTGTSFSAPQVTFVAGLLRNMFPLAPAKDIKLRLLQSADLNVNLADKITDGRVLNARKALSVYWDVVERIEPDGSTSLLRGHLINPPNIEDFCNNFSIPNGAHLLKVRFRFDGSSDSSGLNLVYWIDSAKTFRRSTCTANHNDIALDKEGETITISSAGIRDIVFSSK